MNIKRQAIDEAMEYRKRAVTFKSKVGACLYTQTALFGGFNFETHIHKGYHAEEVALIRGIISGAGKKEFIGIVIAYDFEHSPGRYGRAVYPACASCRQFLWEFTNPDLLISVADTNGRIMYENTLDNLYPYPYPMFNKKDRRKGLKA